MKNERKHKENEEKEKAERKKKRNTNQTEELPKKLTAGFVREYARGEHKT